MTTNSSKLGAREPEPMSGYGWIEPTPSLSLSLSSTLQAKLAHELHQVGPSILVLKKKKNDKFCFKK